MAATVSRPGPSTLSAFVLHHHDWSESSLILDLFTRERGRLAVVAKGAKRPYSQLRSVLMPFQRIQVGLGRAPVDDAAEVFNLRHAEWQAAATWPRGPALLPAYYLNELLLKLLPRQDPHPRVFAAYALSLAALSDDRSAPEPASVQAVLRGFELWLLRELGHLPELHKVTSTQQPLREHQGYRLGPEGLEPAPPGSEKALSATAWQALESALSACTQQAEEGLALGWSAWLQACAPNDTPHDPVALRQATREVLDYHLGADSLRSRQVMRGVHRLLAQAAQSSSPEADLASAPPRRRS